VFTTRRYTKPRLPYIYLTFPNSRSNNTESSLYELCRRSWNNVVGGVGSLDGNKIYPCFKGFYSFLIGGLISTRGQAYHVQLINRLTSKRSRVFFCHRKILIMPMYIYKLFTELTQAHVPHDTYKVSRNICNRIHAPTALDVEMSGNYFQSHSLPFPMVHSHSHSRCLVLFPFPLVVPTLSRSHSRIYS